MSVLGKVVSVVFDDHSTGTEPLRFVAYGKVLVEAPTHIVLGTWHYTEDDSIDDNVETFCIMRPAIVSLDVLEE